MNERMDESIRKFGASLAVGGWSNVINWPLFNAMFVTSTSKQFLGSIDITRFQKTTEYQTSIMERFIEEVGSQNIVQICIDNASSMKSVVEIVMQKYPYVYFQGCVVHAMNLLLEDWRKIRWMKEVIQKRKDCGGVYKEKTHAIGCILTSHIEVGPCSVNKD